jgi:hypothetical protein
VLVVAIVGAELEVLFHEHVTGTGCHLRDRMKELVTQHNDQVEAFLVRGG